jgi:diguanylate cyclase (GGDEF)-like protein/PAS domain S-box-containing protein
MSQSVAPASELDLFSFAGAGEQLRDVSEAFARLLGLTAGEIDGRPLLEFVHPNDRGALSDGLGALAEEKRETRFECRFVQRDGRPVYLRWRVRSLPGKNLWRAAGTDSADLVELMAERADLQTRLDLAIGQATAAMWELDVPTGRLKWEPQAAEILGVNPQDLPSDAAALADAVYPDDRQVVHTALARLQGEGTTEVGLRIGPDAGLRHLSLRGRILEHGSNGRPQRAVGLLLDITTEKAMEEQLLRMSVSDALTGTPNRRAFDQALRGEWRRGARAREPVSIVMVDIDGFKQFNDSFGHLVGDQALITVARALTAALHREGDLLARYGGEEFSIVLPGTDVPGALAVGRRLVGAVRAITVRQAPGWNLSVSVGTASWHPDREMSKSTAVLSRADEALYAAKAAGKNRVIAYEESLAARDTLHAAIAKGLEEREFELFYQPIVSVATGDLIAFEALMRWNRTGHGLVAPDAFIPIAETTSLICDLGGWALHEAARQLATWSHEGLDVNGELRVAVNVSARHAATSEIITDVEAALAAAGIAPDRLELELTETALRGDVAGTHLARARSLGVRVAIDDFGTGYTSIGELAHMPADVLKIDRSFTASPDPNRRSLVKLMIEAAHAFDLRVVAEGIEDEQTMQRLRELNCDDGQGYLIARPMPAQQITGWLEQRRTGTPASSSGRTPQPALRQ